MKHGDSIDGEYMVGKRIKTYSPEIKLIIYNLFISFVSLSLIWAFDLKEEYGMMLLYSINSAIVFALLFREEVVNYKGLSPNLLLLIGYTLRLVYPSLEMSIGAINGERYDFLFYENNVTDYIFPTVVWMNIYYMAFYYAFIRFSKGITLDGYINPYLDKYHFMSIAILMFIPGLLYEIVTSFIPAFVIPSIVNTIFGGLTKLALLIQVFNAALRYTKLKHRVLIILVVSEMLRAMFFGFYKSPIMVPFIFYMLFVFLRCKSQGKSVITPKLMALVVAFFAFITFFVYPFMTIKRIESGFSVEVGATGIATREYSNVDIIKDVLAGGGKYETEELSTSGRFNAIPANAFFYKESVTKGLRTFVLAKSNAELLVPRFINPKKHAAQAGLMTFAYAHTGSFMNYDVAVSNNYVGQFASGYLLGGGLLTIILAFLNGMLMIVFYNYLTKNITNFFALILIVGQLFSTLEGFEEIHDGGVLRAGLTLAYMLIVYITNPLFVRIKVKPSGVDKKRIFQKNIK